MPRKTFIWNWHGTVNLGFGKRNVVIDQRMTWHFTCEQLQAGNPVAWYPVPLHLNRFQVQGKTLRPRVWRTKEHRRNVGITINTTVKCYTNLTILPNFKGVHRLSNDCTGCCHEQLGDASLDLVRNSLILSPH